MGVGAGDGYSESLLLLVELSSSLSDDSLDDESSDFAGVGAGLGLGLGEGVGDGSGEAAGSFFFFFFFFFFFVTVPHLQQSVDAEGSDDGDDGEGSIGVVVGAAVVVASYKPRYLCPAGPPD